MRTTERFNLAVAKRCNTSWRRILIWHSCGSDWAVKLRKLIIQRRHFVADTQHKRQRKRCPSHGASFCCNCKKPSQARLKTVAYLRPFVQNGIKVNAKSSTKIPNIQSILAGCSKSEGSISWSHDFTEACNHVRGHRVGACHVLFSAAALRLSPQWNPKSMDPKVEPK